MNGTGIEKGEFVPQVFCKFAASPDDYNLYQETLLTTASLLSAKQTFEQKLIAGHYMKA